MIEHVDENFAAEAPRTPLHPDGPRRYRRCNLCNRVVHPDSIVVDCQCAQVLWLDPATGEPLAAPATIGRGVGSTHADSEPCARGGVTADDVRAVADALAAGGSEDPLT